MSSGGTAPVIDAHQHFWDIAAGSYPWMAGEAMRPLRRNFGPADLRPLLNSASVDACISVQCRHDLEETRALLKLADTNPWIIGVVGWVDLSSAVIASDIQTLQREPGGRRLIGIRHIAHDEPDAGWFARSDIVRGLRAVAAAGLTSDLLVRARELPSAIAAVRQVPEGRFVLDHLAKPQIGAGIEPAWFALIEEIAALPNVWCKLSGMVTEAWWRQWSPDDFAPAISHVMQCFGPERLMFGSDWPVCLLSASYQDVKRLLMLHIAGLNQSSRDGILGGNACAAYALPAGALANLPKP